MTVQSRSFAKSRWPEMVAPSVVSNNATLSTLAQSPQPGRIDPERRPPDARLVAQLGPAYCLQHTILPWRRCGSATVILAESPSTLERQSAMLRQTFGPLRFALASQTQIRNGLFAVAGTELVQRAETRSPAQFSCRNWDMNALRRRAMILVTAIAVAVFVAPLSAASLVLCWLCFVMAANCLLRLGALCATFTRPDCKTLVTATEPAFLPVVSLLVPLYHEREIAHHLLKRLGRLDYPSDKLDICLVLEADDHLTRMAIAAARLTPNIQIITVPSGTIKTKPRALNFALDFAKGSIIGIYDAEDAPAVDQIRKVVTRFAELGPDVGCLQGILDFYNPRSNWIARCFALEYAVWFRLILPGLQAAGLVIPLGGTTLFLRRSAIDDVGGWDAHNVTEDADLGVRLARQGYRTVLIDSVTEEEANAGVWPWVRQRSRWLKGYAITWAVHMTRPKDLWLCLGPWRFIGFQVLFLGTLSQFVLAPLLWSLWLIPLGLPHFLWTGMAQPWPAILIATFLISEAISLLCIVVATGRAGYPRLAIWAPCLQVYFPLATIAVYRALWEVMTRPYFWHKTSHGAYGGSAICTGQSFTPRPLLLRRPASSG